MASFSEQGQSSWALGEQTAGATVNAHAGRCGGLTLPEISSTAECVGAGARGWGNTRTLLRKGFH